MWRRFDNQGSASLIMAVVMAAGLTVFILNADRVKTMMKAKEIDVQLATGNAQLSNLSAISYLHATLEGGPTSDALLKVDTGNKITGAGNARIQVDAGTATYSQLNPSTATPEQIAAMFGGSPPALSNLNADKTKLEILEATKAGHAATYVVKATTMAKQGDRTYAPVSTVGRIRVNLVPNDGSAPSGGGQEVLTDCVTCVARALELTLTIGYVGDITKTRNFGFYKVQAAANLCDVHFLKNINDSIEDHDGKTSVLKTQVAVYCPCDCGWAR